MKKIEVTKEQMVEALKVNGKEPWTVLGMKRRSWFDILKRNEVTMTELRSSANVSANVNANVPVRTIKPVPQWSPDVTKEANTVGRGGVRYRYTDTGKYNEFVKEDAFRIMERAMKNEVTHKPVERQLNLINIKEENGKQTVSARELHEKLEIKTQFKDWFKRMLEYAFEEGKDYRSFLSESTGGRPAVEYYISIDMAKEICMIQRSDKGRMFRQYFIECERRVKEQSKLTMPQTYIEAVESLLNELKKN